MSPRFPIQTQPAFSLLDDPAALPPSNREVDPGGLLADLGSVVDPALNPRQREAFDLSFSERISLLWGPPGTGKTTVSAGIIAGWLEHAAREGRPISIGIGSSNWKAIDHLLGKTATLLTERRRLLGEYDPPVKMVRIRSDHSEPYSGGAPVEDITRNSPAAKRLAQELAASSQSFVVAGTWLQLSKLAKKASGSEIPATRWFDLLLIDEASQVKVAPALGYFLLLKEDANVVLSGDHRQLGPIYTFEFQGTGEGLLDCVFTFMEQTHHVAKTLLVENYRTNIEIAGWPRQRFYEDQYRAVFSNRRLQVEMPQEQPDGWPNGLCWDPALLKIFDPALPIAVVTYSGLPYTLSNPFEAQLMAALACLYRFSLPEEVDAEMFWGNRLGIVTPHRAQVSMIKNLLHQASVVFPGAAPAVDTVDRFQGQEREVIFSSYSVADRDFVRSEEAFILDPRRFNVTLTRAERKFVMAISDTLVRHLPNDAEVARDAAHLQLFIEDYCDQVDRVVPLSFAVDGVVRTVECRLRGRETV